MPDADISLHFRLYRDVANPDTTLKPGMPAASPAASQRQFGFLPAPQPGGRVAEALAAIFPPAARPLPRITILQFLLPPFRRPARLSSRAAAPLDTEQILPFTPRRIAEPHPGEMKEFVQQNAPVLACVGLQIPIQHNQTVANESTRVSGVPSGIHQTFAVTNFDRLSRKNQIR